MTWAVKLSPVFSISAVTFTILGSDMRPGQWRRSKILLSGYVHGRMKDVMIFDNGIGSLLESYEWACKIRTEELFGREPQ